MTEHEIGSVTDFSDGDKKLLSLDGVDIGVFQIDGQWLAEHLRSCGKVISTDQNNIVFRSIGVRIPGKPSRFKNDVGGIRRHQGFNQVGMHRAGPWLTSPPMSQHDPFKFLRWVGLAEAVSFLVLLGIGMPLKYAMGQPLVVKIAGPMRHGG